MKETLASATDKKTVRIGSDPDSTGSLDPYPCSPDWSIKEEKKEKFHI
jgi:hypothetical protein